MPFQYVRKPFTPAPNGAPRSGHGSPTTLVEGDTHEEDLGEVDPDYVEPELGGVEPELDDLTRLLDADVYRPTCRAFHPPWVAKREAAAVALCWLVGVRPYELPIVARRDWRPERREVLRLDYRGRHDHHRRRELPVVQAAAEVVESYLRACPFRQPPDGPLLLRYDGAPFDRMDVLGTSFRVRRATGGRLWLGTLAGRFRLYVSLTGREDGAVERLCGCDGPFCRLDPSADVLERVVREAHPLGRERNIFGRLRALRARADLPPMPAHGKRVRYVRRT